jgi:nucleotide-binding universal stress UspA family protein
MATVLAALDNSLAVNPVLVMARALARAFGDGVQAIHVVGEGAETAEDASRAAGVPLRLSSGPVVERLVEAGDADDVSVMVIGARGTTRSGHPLGSTALAVVTSMTKPVVVVPPAARVAPIVRRVLVPIVATSVDALAPLWNPRLAKNAMVEVIARDLAGSTELLAPTAREYGVDMIVLGWSGTVSPMRTPLVIEALRHGNLPVMLIPATVRSKTGESVTA